MKKLLWTLICCGVVSTAMPQQSLADNRKLDLQYTLQTHTGLNFNWSSLHFLDEGNAFNPSKYTFRSDYGVKLGNGRLSLFAESIGANGKWNAKQNIGLAYKLTSQYLNVDFQLNQRDRNDLFKTESGTDIKINISSKF